MIVQKCDVCGKEKQSYVLYLIPRGTRGRIKHRVLKNLRVADICEECWEKICKNIVLDGDLSQAIIALLKQEAESMEEKLKKISSTH